MTDEQYAIEFGRQLVSAARRYMNVSDEYAFQLEEGGDDQNRDMLTDAWRALQEAIHEFEKRADRAYPQTQS